ncbi:hypothetical protein Fmac_020127 [Flemingia macrophylla]|uniref:EXPERA domain-containing protein n=1 Tax=Flemingia macrophylla TaxID=520843 RepID=A0ABD1M9S2_9FABA
MDYLSRFIVLHSNPRITDALRKSKLIVLMCWWAFTSLTHIIVEGYFVFSPDFFKDKTGFYLAEAWKEYSKWDSRYAGRDGGIVTVLGITAALEGPASLLAV